MRFNIIHLSLGLASVVYAVPVRHMVSVSTEPVTKRATIPDWDFFGGPPINLKYHYIPPSTAERQQDNKYAPYTDGVVHGILDRKSERITTVPFTGDPRHFAFNITTPIRVFDVECPCIVDVVVVPKEGTGAQAKSTFRESPCQGYFINGVPPLPDGLDPHAKPPTRPASPASNSPHCPASPHSPGPPHSPAHSSDSWYTTDSDSPPSPGPPHPDSHSNSATSALPQSPGSPHPDSHSDSATSASAQSPGAPHPHSDSHSDSATSPATHRYVNHIGSLTVSGSASVHNGNTFYY